MNNTEAHGPGGQHQHHLEEFADSCFATVVDGFETLEMIYREQVCAKKVTVVPTCLFRRLTFSQCPLFRWLLVLFSYHLTPKKTKQTFPNGHEWGWFYVHPVHIVGATLLEQTPPPFPADALDENNDLSAEPEEQSAFPAKPLKLDQHLTDVHQVVP